MSFWADAVDAADDLLERVHEIQKAPLDPLDPDDYVRLVARLERSLRSGAQPHESAAIRAALRVADVDWPNLTEARRDRVFDAIRTALETAAPRVVPAVSATLRGPGGIVFGPTRANLVRELPRRIVVSPNLSQRDLVAERLVRENASNFVRDEFGRRVDHLSELAREVVARGLEEGLGRDAIAANIGNAMGSRLVRSESYWNVVAGSYVTRARTYSSLLTFEDAGAQTYTFEAILDEVTTDICRFMHGQSFSVGGGRAAMDRALALEDPEEIREVNPWVREGRLPDGRRELFVQRGEARVRVAEVVRSGVGRRDDRGEFARGLSPAEIEAMGLPYPPLHGRCRSTIVADF